MEPISLAFSAIKVAASIASFLEQRQTRKLLQNKQADALDQHRRDVLLVLGTLGETLLRLGIVDIATISEATEDVRRCLRLKSSELGEIFEKDLEKPLQYAVATGLFFCAACWPMHIHRGFGCSVLNQDHWNDRWDHSNTRTWRFAWEDQSTPTTTQEPVLRTVDDCIAVLKPSVQRLHMLSKVPSGLSQIGVSLTNSGNEKYKKKARAWLNDVYTEVRKRGPPQPKDGSFQTTEMIVGFAGWHSYTGYSNIFGEENPYYPVKCQGDPGKLLYAYTIGNQLDLQQGQILMPIDRIQYILLMWLAGLDGMTFKLMRDDEFDDKHPKFKKTNRWIFEWNTTSINVVATRDDSQSLIRQQSIAQTQTARQDALTAEKKPILQTDDIGKNTTRKKKTAPAAQAEKVDESTLEELFLVLDHLGQRLNTLGVINQSALESSHASVRHSISLVAKSLSKKFEELLMPLQHSITCAIIFCAACYPMHIYRGFGCGVLDNTLWGMHPDNPQYPYVSSSEYLTAMDKVLAYQKGLTDTLRLLNKTPVGVDKELPRFEPICDEDVLEKLERLSKDQTQAYETCGFPRPKDSRIKINSWENHFATWQWATIYDNVGHSVYLPALWQSDPGRMLYGWTVWNRLNLKPGQAACLPGDPSCALAQWLEGLEGMTFKLLKDEELDYSHISYSAELSRIFWTTGNAHGLEGTPTIVVLDPKFIVGSSATLETVFSDLGLGLDMASSVGSIPSSSSTIAEPSNPRRRPPPPPPLPEVVKVHVVRKARAMYDFAATEPEELSFTAGDVLEIIDTERDDGWWVAKVGGISGLVPCGYVEDI